MTERTTGPGRVTMAQIARQAKVSISTVSKVLNEGTDVSAETRGMIKNLFAEVGYQRPRLKRGAGRGDIVDLVINELDSPWSLALLIGVEEVVAASGLALVVAAVHNSPKLTTRWLESQGARGSQGVILITSDLTQLQHKTLVQRGVPFVVVDGVTQAPQDVCSVSATNFAGGRAATEHLIELGHRRIAVIGGPPNTASTRARIAGYHAAVADAGLSATPELVRYAEFNHAGGFEATRQLLALPDRPTAIFVCSDQQSRGVYRELALAGLEIPGQMSVVGFDDVDFAQWTTPPLTTVRQPLHEMGATAARMLLSLIDGDLLGPAQVELETTLIIRQSTMRQQLAGLGVASLDPKVLRNGE